MGGNNSVIGDGNGLPPVNSLESARAAQQVQHTLRDRVLKMPVKDRQECELYKILKRPEDRIKPADGAPISMESTTDKGGNNASGDGDAKERSSVGGNDVGDSNLSQVTSEKPEATMAPKKKFLERNRSSSFSTSVAANDASSSSLSSLTTIPPTSNVDDNSTLQKTGSGNGEEFRSRSSSLSLRQSGMQLPIIGVSNKNVVDMRSCIDAILESELLKKASPAPVSSSSSQSLTLPHNTKRPSSKDSTRPCSRDPRLGRVDEEESVIVGHIRQAPLPHELPQMKGALIDSAGTGDMDGEPGRKMARRDIMGGRYSVDIVAQNQQQPSRSDLDRMALAAAQSSRVNPAAWVEKEQSTSGRRATMPSNFGVHGQGYHPMRLPPAAQGGGSIVTGQAPTRVCGLLNLVRYYRTFLTCLFF